MIGQTNADFDNSVKIVSWGGYVQRDRKNVECSL